MIPNDEPLRSQTLERMINHLLFFHNYENLTKWEQDFIASVKTYFDSNSKISTRQCEIIERLYDKS